MARIFDGSRWIKTRVDLWIPGQGEPLSKAAILLYTGLTSLSMEHDLGGVISENWLPQFGINVRQIKEYLAFGLMPPAPKRGTSIYRLNDGRQMVNTRALLELFDSNTCHVEHDLTGDTTSHETSKLHIICTKYASEQTSAEQIKAHKERSIRGGKNSPGRKAITRIIADKTVVNRDVATAFLLD